MKILVLYDWFSKSNRSTIGEYLWSFKKYSGEDVCYLNTAYGIPSYLSRISFDVIIYHWSFFDPNIRLTASPWPNIAQKLRVLKDLKGYKVAMPQDDYRGTDKMNRFLREFGIRTLFTPVPASEWEKLYPRERSGVEHYFTVLTGYIEQAKADKLASLNKPHRSRPIDAGYRGSNPPYWLGRAGLMKRQLTEKFLNAPVKHNLKLDLSNEVRDIFYGDDWYKFLADCRIALGCEGGATLHDPDGRLMKKVDRYVMRHPGATFEEVEQACFPGLDGWLNFLVLSPRMFDACMTGTCQVLIEGEYGGIIKPGVHYIEIKKDWSNLEAAIRQMEDVDLCQRLADNAYRQVVESGLYTYEKFVRFIIDHVKQVALPAASAPPDEPRLLNKLARRETTPWLYSPVTFLSGRTKEVVYRTLLKFKLYKFYKKIESRVKN